MGTSGISGISLEDKGVTFSSAYCTMMGSSEDRISASSSCSPLFHGPSWDVYPMFRQAHNTYYNNIYIYYTDTFLRQWCLVTSYNISDIYILSYVNIFIYIIHIYIYVCIYIYIFTIYVYTPLKPAVFLVFFQVDDPNMTDAGYGSRWVMGPSRDGAAKSLGIWDTLW